MVISSLVGGRSRPDGRALATWSQYRSPPVRVSATWGRLFVPPVLPKSAARSEIKLLGSSPVIGTSWPGWARGPVATVDAVTRRRRATSRLRHTRKNQLGARCTGSSCQMQLPRHRRAGRGARIAHSGIPHMIGELESGTGVLSVTDNSVTIAIGLFADGRCNALADSVLLHEGSDGQRPWSRDVETTLNGLSWRYLGAPRIRAAN